MSAHGWCSGCMQDCLRYENIIMALTSSAISCLAQTAFEVFKVKIDNCRLAVQMTRMSAPGWCAGCMQNCLRYGHALMAISSAKNVPA